MDDKDKNKKKQRWEFTDESTAAQEELYLRSGELSQMRHQSFFANHTMYCHKTEHTGFTDTALYMVIALEYDRNAELHWINLAKTLKNSHEIQYWSVECLPNLRQLL